MELEQGKNVDFWRDMTIITEDEIIKLRKLEASGKGPGTEYQTKCMSRKICYDYKCIIFIISDCSLLYHCEMYPNWLSS